MNTESRRLIFAMVAAFAVFIGYQFITTAIFGTPEPAKPAQPAPGEPPAPAPETSKQPVPTPTTTADQPVPTPGTTQGNPFVLTSAEDFRQIVLGGGEDDDLRLTLDPHGASVAKLELCSRDKKGRYEFKTERKVEKPYVLLSAMPENEPRHFSFETYRVWLKIPNANDPTSGTTWKQKLNRRAWEIVSEPGDTATFRTALQDANASDALVFTKTYRLLPDKPVFEYEVTIHNPGTEPRTLWLEQDGPIGMQREHLQRDMRQLLTAQHTDSVVSLNKGLHRDKLAAAIKGDDNTTPLAMTNRDWDAVAWTALVNRYFGVFTRPLPVKGQEDFIQSVSGLTIHRNSDKTDIPGDLLSRITTKPHTIPAGEQVTYRFEVYAGPKDPGHLEDANPAYLDTTTLYYQLAQSADRYCSCTFQWLQDLMVWLLETIHAIVRNYGIAIIILVCIIRGLLHPLTVFQQKSMFKMQESMAKIQPRMAAIKEKFANDKVRLNQEMMKVWGEEGINPAGQFVAFIPLFLQMPILIALWTGLNTDVNLRHAAFDPWWITDLSAPDAAIPFDSPKDLILFSWIPLIGDVFKGFTSVNLLPILMGVSMWLQQKYMPKPHLKAKLEAAKKDREAGKPRSGMSPEDQLRQQQMMAYMMSIMFPLMFYSMPSGLNLYWMATNVFGIFESILIRKQIDRDKKRRELLGPAPKKKKAGFVTKFLKRMADQAEELQRKADELSKTEAKKPDKGKKKK